MDEQSEGWRPPQLFWRYHPHQDLNGEGAFSNPHFNGIYIPGLRPSPGSDLFDSFSELPSRLALSKLERFLHELVHIIITATPLWRLQKQIVHALWLLLYSLDDRTILSLPSWQISGKAELTRIIEKSIPLLKSLDHETRIVDETICNALTLANLNLLRVARRASVRISDENYLELEKHIKKVITTKIDPNSKETIIDEDGEKIWAFSETLLQQNWFAKISETTVDEESALRIYRSLIGIGLYCYDPSPKTLKDIWQTGHIPPEDSPQARLRSLLLHLQGTSSADEAINAMTEKWQSEHRRSGVRDLLQKVQDLAIAKGRPGEIFLEDFSEVQESFSPSLIDPFIEVATSLRINPDKLYFKHPIGRAISYLNLGYAPRSENEMRKLLLSRNEILPDGRELILPPPWETVVPIITKEQEGALHCYYLARFPCGDRFVDVGGDKPAFLQLWEQADPVLLEEAQKSRTAVLPATKEVTLAWDIQRILEDLVLTGHLHCLCGPTSNRPKDCSYRQLLSRVYQHIRTADGRHLPPIECLH
ncbi:MAG: hypothetical protein EPO21_21900 [Chloroflexota bacterium]|nr:MAG: hypothetical protein EPO21_21900 [Chloroflexota bacterium]